MMVILKRADPELWADLVPPLCPVLPLPLLLSRARLLLVQRAKDINPQFYGLRWLSLLLSQEFDLPDVVRHSPTQTLCLRFSVPSAQAIVPHPSTLSLLGSPDAVLVAAPTLGQLLLCRGSHHLFAPVLLRDAHALPT
jgi:hypothetical protein